MLLQEDPIAGIAFQYRRGAVHLTWDKSWSYQALSYQTLYYPEKVPRSRPFYPTKNQSGRIRNSYDRRIAKISGITLDVPIAGPSFHRNEAGAALYDDER